MWRSGHSWWYKSDYCLEQKSDWSREGAFNRDSTIFGNLCDVWDTTMLISCGVIPDLSDDVYGHSVEDYDLAVSPTTGKESGVICDVWLFFYYHLSWECTCL